MESAQGCVLVEHDLHLLGTEQRRDYIPHVLCTRGRFDFTLAGEPFTLEAGQTMILVQQQQFAATGASKDLAVSCVYVSSEFVERCTPRSNYGIRGTLSLFVQPIMSMDAGRFDQLSEDFRQIEQRLQQTSHAFLEDVLICATQAMFLDFFDIHTALNGTKNISFQDSDLIARFMQMLEEGDYIKHREVGHYAYKLCVTPKYLSEVCKSASGFTANYWIMRFTVMHIRRLLQERQMSFTEIADLFEFSSPAYFSRFVQKHLGASPTSFRE